MKTNDTIFFFRNAAPSMDAAHTESTTTLSAPGAGDRRLTSLGRQAIASALLLFMVPLSMGDLYAQDAPPPPPDYGDQGAPPQGSAYQPLGPEDVNRLVAPIALYPDSLVAQVLAASTYPAQIASAEQFVQQYNGAPPDQIAQMANQQPWDPSVKALTAFPQVLGTLNSNMNWTTQLGNAYYNQPQDVMNAVQVMRGRAYQSGNLRPTQQLNVVYAPGNIVIEPVSPAVVYVPYYNPWVVYGAPIAPWGGYYYHPGIGIAFGAGLAIGFGVGIAIGAFTHFAWGFHSWAPNWGAHTIAFQHNTYISNSVTVINHGNYGGFDRNPQARAFNHEQAARFANVNHTTINNVTVNRTNVNNNYNNRTNINANARGGAPNNGAAGFNPRTQQNYNRGAQPGQFNNGARPAQAGQFNNGARPAQGGQFNGGARPAPQAGQFNGGARPANGGSPQGYNRGAAPQQHAAAPQQHAQAQHESKGEKHSEPKADKHEHR